MDAVDSFVDRIVEATNQGNWQEALDAWNELSQKAEAAGQNEKILEVYQGLSEVGVSMAEIVRNVHDTDE